MGHNSCPSVERQASVMLDVHDCCLFVDVNVADSTFDGQVVSPNELDLPLLQCGQECWGAISQQEAPPRATCLSGALSDSIVAPISRAPGRISGVIGDVIDT